MDQTTQEEPNDVGSTTTLPIFVTIFLSLVIVFWIVFCVLKLVFILRAQREEEKAEDQKEAQQIANQPYYFNPAVKLNQPIEPVFDHCARFDERVKRIVPPAPPGVVPNAAQYSQFVQAMNTEKK